MRRPTRKTPSRGQRSPRRPTPLPSPPVRGGPKGPPKPRSVRGGPKDPPKPRPVRGGRRITEKPRGPKTRPNTGTSTKTAQLQKRAQAQAQLDAVKKTTSNIGTSTKTNAQPRTLQPAKVQPQVTAAERNKLIASARAAEQAKLDNKPATGGQAKKVTPAELARIKAGNAARNKAPTGSRAAAMRRRKRRGGGGLAGALRRRRARMGR